MEFEQYLLVRKWLTQAQFSRVVLKKARFIDLEKGANIKDEYVDDSVAEKTGTYDVSDLRQDVGGDILRQMSPNAKTALAGQAGTSDTDELVKSWRQWHVEKMEPIGTYPTTTKFGQELYTRQFEKKLVGHHVACRGLVTNGEHVVIPEGSSAFYVGLAVAAKRSNTRIVTSNWAMMREYADNPVLASALVGLDIIGGESDYEHGGVFGKVAQKNYAHAIGVKPGATVVIMPVNGLLADEGPFAWDGAYVDLKRHIINVSLRKPVRQIVFIADHSKHHRLVERHGRQEGELFKLGTPVYAAQDWRRIVQENVGRISIVTTPPPRVREAIIAANYPDIRTRTTAALPGSEEFDPIDIGYLREVKELEKLVRGSGPKPVSLFEACEFNY